MAPMWKSAIWWANENFSVGHTAKDIEWRSTAMAYHPMPCVRNVTHRREAIDLIGSATSAR